MLICCSSPRRLLPGALLAFLISSVLSTTRADILGLDWAHLSAAYQSGAANATTAQSFTVGSNTLSTVFATETTSGTAGGFAFNSPVVGTYGRTAPNTTTYSNGGTTDGELALQIGIALTDSTAQDMKFTINFSQAVYGATFRLFDLDANTTSTGFVDQVRNIFGTNGGATVLPMLTGSASNQVGSDANNLTAGYLNSVTGTANANQNTGDGNVTVTFDSATPITSISFVYGDNTVAALGAVAPASPSTEIIALSNVYWSTVSGQSVPEPGTLATIGLGLAGMVGVVLRQKRQD